VTRKWKQLPDRLKWNFFGNGNRRDLTPDLDSTCAFTMARLNNTTVCPGRRCKCESQVFDDMQVTSQHQRYALWMQSMRLMPCLTASHSKLYNTMPCTDRHDLRLRGDIGGLLLDRP
jgi:hypothetical protein